MPSPMTVKRNNYLEKPKDNTIETPPGLCEFVHDTVLKSKTTLSTFTVLDPAVGRGNLLAPWPQSRHRRIGFDIVDCPDRIPMSEFHQANFLEAGVKRTDVDLVICNPPFNNTPESRKRYGRVLLPEVFAKKVFDLYGHDTPLVLFTPMGFICNQRIGSARRLSFQNGYADAKITGIASPPLDVFEGVEFHNLILFWNLPGVPQHSWVPERYLSTTT